MFWTRSKNGVKTYFDTIDELFAHVNADENIVEGFAGY